MTRAMRCGRTATWLLPLALVAGCGGASVTSVEGGRTAEPTAAERAAMVATHTDPSPAGKTEANVSARAEDVAFDDADRRRFRAQWSQRLIAPYVLDDPDAAPIPLVGGAFPGSDRFRVEGVPAGVTFYRVADQPATWEVRDPEGGRLALVQEEEWSSVMKPSTEPPLSAPVDAPAAGGEHRLDDWGGRPATIVAEQYVTPLRLYRVERLAEKTEWLAGGFVYEPPEALPEVE